MRTLLPNAKALNKDYNPFAQKFCCICGTATGEADSWLLCSRSPEGQEYAISHPRDGFTAGDHAYVVPIGASCLKKHPELRHALVGETTRPEALRSETIEECAKVCDGMAERARAVWDSYIAKCRENPDNIGGGSQSWHHYFEACAEAIRATASAPSPLLRSQEKT